MLGRFTSYLATLFRAYEADEVDAARFRARQIQAILRLTPLAMLINFLNVLVVAFALWSEPVNRSILLGWAVTVTALSVLGFRGWLRARSRPEHKTASRRAMRHGVFQAAMLGLAWGALPLLFQADLHSTAQFYVGMVTVGMVCAGGFALSSMPAAGTAYVVCLGSAAAWALFSSGLEQSRGFAGLLLVYSVVVVYSVWSHAKSFGARLVAEARAERQNEVISLLLKDFEDHTSDLLWELDRSGRFVHVSSRLAHVVGVPGERLARLHGLALLRRWMPRDEQGVQQWKQLQTHLRNQRAFRDQHLSLLTRRGRSWWALSARPLVDENGNTLGWRGVAADITDKQVAHMRLSWLANNDSLTGLVNRRQFREMLETLLQSPAQGDNAFAVVVFDLDDFKQINDGRGHAAGDHALSQFGQRLLAVSRRSDTVARLGGDEFAMVLRGAIEQQEVRTMLDRLLQALNGSDPQAADAENLPASMGVAFAPGDGKDVDTLLNHADLALYAAKHAGGNQYRFFEPSLADGNRRRAALAQALRGAIERDELRLAFQPQVTTSDQRICGFEALLRWHHAEYGDVSPSEFVPIAETAGLMHAIGDWVLHKACEEAALWREDINVSINISAAQLTAPDFVARVQSAASGIASGRVELEVTESVLIDDGDTAVASLRRLRALGFRTALDDFGTGYSALGYLRQFPFDTLKIDRSFVRDLYTDHEAQVLVETIVAMARALGMATVAEGVEDVRQASMLAEHGCGCLQGYLISRPMPAHAVAAFIHDWQGIDEIAPVQASLQAPLGIA
ncbi:MAG: EAL domain-containing protein [Rhodoferax sp.]|nr:EAL domain-containing protein [Rhodoferax sp.]